MDAGRATTTARSLVYHCRTLSYDRKHSNAELGSLKFITKASLSSKYIVTVNESSTLLAGHYAIIVRINPSDNGSYY